MRRRTNSKSAGGSRICQAFQRGDAASLRPLLDDGFILTSSDGVVTDLAQNLEEVRTRDPAYDEYRDHDQIVRLHGDAAIVTGITTVKGRSAGESFRQGFPVHRHLGASRWALAARGKPRECIGGTVSVVPPDSTARGTASADAVPEHRAVFSPGDDRAA